MKNNVYQGLYTDASTSAVFRCAVRFEDKGIVIQDLEEKGRDTCWPPEEIWTDTVHTGGLCMLYRGHRPHSVLKIYAKNIDKIIARRYKKYNFVQEHNDYYINFSRVFSILVTLAVLTAVVYYWVLPPATEYAAKYIPRPVEEKLGDYYMNYLAGSRIDEQKTVLVRQFFAELNWDKEYNYEINVVRSKTANAFALPGGRMIIYSGLLDSLDTYEELAALLAHESAHVELKHCTKNLCRSLSHSIFLALLTGDVNTVFAVLARNADLLSELSYSRSMEETADKHGIQMLEKVGVNPQGMLDLMTKLETLGEHSMLQQYDFISTHPAMEKRKNYIRKQLAENYTGNAAVDSALSAVWQELYLLNNPGE